MDGLSTQNVNERYYEKYDLTQFNTRINRALKDEFEEVCELNGRSGRSVVIELMEKYIARTKRKVIN